MDEEEDIDIAAAMGFGSFGGTKKRKFDHTKSPKATADASGANSTQLGMRTKKKAELDQEVIEDSTADLDIGSNSLHNISSDVPCAAQTLPDRPPIAHQGHQDSTRASQSATETVSFGGPAISRAELNALRFGVRNEHGDNAYFQPSFVEDPWEVLGKGRN